MPVMIFCAGKLVKVGNRTECALLELCVALGGSYTRIRAGHDLVRRFPFSSDRKRMSSLTFSPGGRWVPVTNSVQPRSPVKRLIFMNTLSGKPVYINVE